MKPYHSITTIVIPIVKMGKVYSFQKAMKCIENEKMEMHSKQKTNM